MWGLDLPIKDGIFIDNDGLFDLDEDEEDSPRVTFEVRNLYSSRKYLEALREQSKILQRRRGNCSSWIAENDLNAVVWIADEGEINLGVLKFTAFMRLM
jgi:hypothetical protein